MSWTAPPGPGGSWLADCEVPLVFPADEVAEELLDWLTFPLPAPGLRMLTEIAELLGFVCVEVASDPACWSLPACWPMPCCEPAPPPAAWVAVWSVPLVLPADEVAAELVDWVTFPVPGGGLWMFTECA